VLVSRHGIGLDNRKSSADAEIDGGRTKDESGLTPNLCSSCKREGDVVITAVECLTKKRASA